jgi:hypothetical protein
MTDVNTPGSTDVPGEVWNEGDLPSQGGFGPTLMPGIDEFQLPLTLAQLWDKIDVKDGRASSKTVGQLVKRLRLKFDKNSPLVIVSGPHKGETLTATFTSNPRPRGKPDDEKTPWISDLAYMLEIGCNDKSRPTSASALQAAITNCAGKTIRIEHGLSAHCRSDVVRYIIVATPTGQKDATGQPLMTERTVQDPSGQKGCSDDSKKRPDGKGKQGRFYTRDFKDPETGEYLDTIECDCGAVLRAFPSVERFVPPLGQGK